MENGNPLDRFVSFPGWVRRRAYPEIRNRWFPNLDLPELRLPTRHAQQFPAAPITDEDVARAVAYVDVLLAQGKVR